MAVLRPLLPDPQPGPGSGRMAGKVRLNGVRQDKPGHMR